MKTILQIRSLKKHFRIGRSFFGGKKLVLKAVDDVSLEVEEGKTYGLVGESGSGKTTLGRCVARIIEPTDGSIILDGVDIAKMKSGDLRPLRRNIQMVFQNPLSSLDPKWSTHDLIAEPLVALSDLSSQEITSRVIELLGLVGLNETFLWKHPHEMSGGQTQRVAIARALALNPKFVVLDEPTSALDVSIQAQLINLLEDLQKKFNLTYLFISHDLNTVGYISKSIGVMYLGKIVEAGPGEEVFTNPLHPYTQILLSSLPKTIVEGSKRKRMVGEIPSPLNPPSGCHFRTRCPYATELCAQAEPPLSQSGGGHWVACHHWDKIQAGIPLSS